MGRQKDTIVAENIDDVVMAEVLRWKQRIHTLSPKPLQSWSLHEPPMKQSLQ